MVCDLINLSQLDANLSNLGGETLVEALGLADWPASIPSQHILE